MKKLALFLTFTMFAIAQQADPKTKLIYVLSNLLFNNTNPYIYIKSPEYDSLKIQNSKLNITLNCETANILIISNYKNVPKKCFSNNPVVFVTKYSSFKENKNSLGTIFWQKGRLNLIFRKERLKDLSVSLPKQYNKYIE